MSLFMIGIIVCPLRNIPPFSSSASDATIFLVFVKWLGWDRSVLVWECQ